MPRVNVTFDFDSSSRSKFSVSGEDATWVNGISKRVENIIKKHTLNYSLIKTNWIVKFSLTFLTMIVLVTPLYLWYSSIPTIEPKNLASFIVAIFLYGSMGMYFLIQWLFPFFEYGNSIQKRVRKWIWVILFGSGIIPTIILKYLGF